MLNLSKLLNSLLAKLPAPVAGALKAVAAAVVPLVGQVALDGTLNYQGLATAAVSALAVYFVANFKASKPVAPKPVSAPKTVTPSK